MRVYTYRVYRTEEAVVEVLAFDEDEAYDAACAKAAKLQPSDYQEKGEWEIEPLDGEDGVTYEGVPIAWDDQ